MISTLNGFVKGLFIFRPASMRVGSRWLWHLGYTPVLPRNLMNYIVLRLSGDIHL